MKKILIIGGIAIILLTAFAVFAKKSGMIGKETFTKVVVEAVDNQEVIGIVTASGKIYPQTEVKVSPDVPGEIIELYVEEGDSVKAGQLLLKLKPDDYSTAINRSVSTYNNAQAGIG